jgi:hypothetical protein
MGMPGCHRAGMELYEIYQQRQHDGQSHKHPSSVHSAVGAVAIAASVSVPVSVSVSETGTGTRGKTSIRAAYDVGSGATKLLVVVMLIHLVAYNAYSAYDTYYDYNACNAYDASNAYYDYTSLTNIPTCASHQHVCF